MPRVRKIGLDCCLKESVSRGAFLQGIEDRHVIFGGIGLGKLRETFFSKLNWLRQNRRFAERGLRCNGYV